ncbi:hypothetical protein Tco_1459321 [Tanacetum coccineum]
MIQPEPEDLPKDNPKLEIAVLRMKKKCMDKGSKERSPPHNLRQKLGQYICCQNHKLIADIENDIMDPVVDLTEKTTLLWNAVGGAVPVADVFLQKGARVNAVNIFGFQMATVRHDVQIRKPATSTLDARTLAHIVLAKKLDMASIAHVLLKLTPTQDPRASMGPKEIDHIGGGVAATNFGVIRVEYPKEESYSRFQGLFGIAYWNKGCLGLLPLKLIETPLHSQGNLRDGSSDFKKEKLRADNERMAKEKESVVRIIDELLCWYFQLLGRLLQKTHSSSLLPPKDRSPTLRKRALKWVLLGAEVRAEMDVFGR